MPLHTLFHNLECLSIWLWKIYSHSLKPTSKTTIPQKEESAPGGTRVLCLNARMVHSCTCFRSYQGQCSLPVSSNSLSPPWYWNLTKGVALSHAVLCSTSSWNSVWNRAGMWEMLVEWMKWFLLNSKTFYR